MDDEVFQITITKWRWRCMHFLCCKRKFKAIHKTLISFINIQMGCAGEDLEPLSSFFSIQKWRNDNKNPLAMHNPRPWSVEFMVLYLLMKKGVTFLEISKDVNLLEAKLNKKIVLKPK